jgi:hypothetical protein
MKKKANLDCSMLLGVVEQWTTFDLSRHCEYVPKDQLEQQLGSWIGQPPWLIVPLHRAKPTSLTTMHAWPHQVKCELIHEPPG